MVDDGPVNLCLRLEGRLCLSGWLDSRSCGGLGFRWPIAGDEGAPADPGRALLEVAQPQPLGTFRVEGPTQEPRPQAHNQACSPLYRTTRGDRVEQLKTQPVSHTIRVWSIHESGAAAESSDVFQGRSLDDVPGQEAQRVNRQVKTSPRPGQVGAYGGHPRYMLVPHVEHTDTVPGTYDHPICQLGAGTRGRQGEPHDAIWIVGELTDPQPAPLTPVDSHHELVEEVHTSHAVR